MTTPAPPDDDRDPQVARWLAVDPLDDATRSRLVRQAADAAHPERRRWVVPIVAAAALLVAVLVGVAVLVPRSSDDTTVQASDAPATTAAPEILERAPRAVPDTGFSAPESRRSTGGDLEAVLDLEAALAVPSIGDLGDVSTEDRLRRVLATRLPPADGAPPVTVTGCAAAAGRALGTPIAAGAGRVDGRRAVIVVSQQPGGATAAVAVRGARCGDSVSVVIS